MKLAYLLAITLVLTIASASTVYDDTPSLIYHSANTTTISPEYLLQGGTPDPFPLITIKKPDGSLEFIYSTNIQSALQGYTNSPIGQCTSQHECNTQADAYCEDIGKIRKSAICSFGFCYADCSNNACNSDADCKNTIQCRYCTLSDAKCHHRVCGGQKCGTIEECRDAGIPVKDECTDTASAKEACKDMANHDQAVESAYCRNGQAICKFIRTGKTECRKNSDCYDYIATLCGSINNAERGYNSAYCNIERDCDQDIIRSTCVMLGKCKGETTPTYHCGDGVCDPSENPISCPKDCNAYTHRCGDGECNSGEDPETCPSDCATEKKCTAGYTDEYSCQGLDLVRKYVYSTCITQYRKIKTCEYGCENGKCVETQGGYCGDGVCEAGETCPSDCDTTMSYCGDGVCDNEETAQLCPQDCSNTLFSTKQSNNLLPFLLFLIVPAFILLYYKKVK